MKWFRVSVFITFIVLTRPDGVRLFINTAEIVAFSTNTTGHKDAKTEITAHDRVFYVLETPDQVMRKLHESEP